MANLRRSSTTYKLTLRHYCQPAKTWGLLEVLKKPIPGPQWGAHFTTNDYLASAILRFENEEERYIQGTYPENSMFASASWARLQSRQHERWWVIDAQVEALHWQQQRYANLACKQRAVHNIFRSTHLHGRIIKKVLKRKTYHLSSWAFCL